MAASGIELVRRAIDAFDQGDWTALRELYSPSMTSYAGVLSPEYTGLVEGRDKVLGVFESEFASFDSWNIVPETFIECGDAIIVPMIWRGKPRGSSGVVEQKMIGAFVPRDGVFVHLAWYATVEDAVKAAEGWAANGLPVADEADASALDGPDDVLRRDDAS